MFENDTAFSIKPGETVNSEATEDSPETPDLRKEADVVQGTTVWQEVMFRC